MGLSNKWVSMVIENRLDEIFLSYVPILFLSLTSVLRTHGSGIFSSSAGYQSHEITVGYFQITYFSFLSFSRALAYVLASQGCFSSSVGE